MSLTHHRVQVRKDDLGSEKMSGFFTAVKDGQLDVVTALLTSGDYQKTVDAQDSSGSTCLGLAAQQGDVEMVQLLLNNGCSVNQADFYGQTPLQYAVEESRADVATVLISAGANVNWMDENNDGLSAIHIAACKGHLGMAQLLIRAGCNVNVTDINGVSVLHCAVANAHIEIAEALIKAGARLNLAGSRTGRTPLFLAVEVGDVSMVQLLVKHGARLNHRDDFGLTPLAMACLQNQTEIAALLVQAGTRPNFADKRDNLPLHYAARHGNAHLVQLLLQHGSKVNVLSRYFRHFEGPMHLAVQQGHLEVIQLLLIHGCNVNLCSAKGRCSNYTPLHVAIDSYAHVGLFEEVLLLLIQGDCWLDPPAFPTLETPLFRAVDQGKGYIALCLLQHGADPNIKSLHEISLLQKACQKQEIGVVNALLQCGLDWKAEAWLDSDIHRSGINPKLLAGYAANIPMALLDNVELYLSIQHHRHNPLSLQSLTRLTIRKSVQNQLFIKVPQLGVPSRLVDYLLMKELL